LNGNIQTTALVIEQGAMFEGSCKMIKMNAAEAKTKINGRDVKPLDTSSIKSIAADSKSDSTEIPKISSVAS
jgi:cytoskeletal protein CcmA (bactofilin family)